LEKEEMIIDKGEVSNLDSDLDKDQAGGE